MGRRSRVTDFNLARDVPFASSLKIAKGTTTLDMVAERTGSRYRYTSLLATHLSLPGVFGGVTGDATIRLSNPEGARLDALGSNVTPGLRWPGCSASCSWATRI